MARRFGLPGADELFQRQFNQLFASGDYKGATSCRNVATLWRHVFRYDVVTYCSSICRVSGHHLVGADARYFARRCSHCGSVQERSLAHPTDHSAVQECAGSPRAVFASAVASFSWIRRPGIQSMRMWHDGRLRSSPILHYFSTLLEHNKLNGLESVELVRPVVQQGKLCFLFCPWILWSSEKHQTSDSLAQI